MVVTFVLVLGLQVIWTKGHEKALDKKKKEKEAMLV